jgi:hypothetical protein
MRTGTVASPISKQQTQLVQFEQVRKFRVVSLHQQTLHILKENFTGDVNSKELQLEWLASPIRKYLHSLVHYRLVYECDHRENSQANTFGRVAQSFRVLIGKFDCLFHLHPENLRVGYGLAVCPKAHDRRQHFLKDGRKIFPSGVKYGIVVYDNIFGFAFEHRFIS